MGAVGICAWMREEDGECVGGVGWMVGGRGFIRNLPAFFCLIVKTIKRKTVRKGNKRIVHYAGLLKMPVRGYFKGA
ncbi:hypothetical protein [Candidatus Bartonella washoeensis]|uniref:Uncharacterized protein n=1 Tax=Cardidatus Bartonella washoeensis 085-0475 TaxID=1094564 RepID=J0Z7Q2_9HYPH|nr:hypothetical protein [Bartonella washoeensis]EJF83738.1 hypothetical protein MCW_01287 [Bartonella washoeensis 085-0475]